LGCRDHHAHIVCFTLAQGERPSSFSVGANRQTLNRLDRVVTRLSLSVLIAAFILGLALLLPISTGNQAAEMMVIFGFVVVFSLGVWLMVSILRSGE
jgi:apolipoprotein N-acyltransferase